MEIITVWVGCGGCASVWWLSDVALNRRNACDHLTYRLRNYSDGHQILITAATGLLLLVAGPLGLADVIITEIRKRKNG